MDAVNLGAEAATDAFATVESDGIDPETPTRMTVWVSGHVQGVGFRWWTRCRALELALVGSATNLPDGRVEVVAQGSRGNCEELFRLLSVQPAPPVPVNAPRSYYRRPGRVDGVIVSWMPLSSGPGAALTGFVER